MTQALPQLVTPSNNVDKVVGEKISEDSYNTVPIAKEDMEFLAIVIRWMYFEMRKGTYTPHAIFAKEYPPR